MKKSIKKLEVKSIKSIKTVKAGDGGGLDRVEHFYYDIPVWS